MRSAGNASDLLAAILFSLVSAGGILGFFALFIHNSYGLLVIALLLLIFASALLNTMLNRRADIKRRRGSRHSRVGDESSRKLGIDPGALSPKMLSLSYCDRSTDSPRPDQTINVLVRPGDCLKVTVNKDNQGVLIVKI